MTLPWLVVCCSETIVVAGWLMAGPATTPTRTGRLARAPAPELAWRVAGDGRGTPAVAGSVVYFLSKRHEVVAVDVASGRVRWSRPTGEPGDATAGSTVIATSTTVIAGDYNVVAFDRDGVARWRFTPREGYGPGLYLGERSSALVFAGSPSGHLFAIDLATGVERWSHRVERDERTTVLAPIVSDEMVIAGFTSFRSPMRGGLIAVEVATGRERWRAPLPSGPGATVASGSTGGPLAVGDLVIGAGRDGTIYAFDRSTGRSRWSLPGVPARFQMPADGTAHDFRALTVTGRTLVAGSLSGIVAAYDLDTRRERWRRTPIDASVAFGMSADERTIYVPYLSGTLVALDVRDGHERWRTPEEVRGFTWPPRLWNGAVLAVGSGGLFAFRS